MGASSKFSFFYRGFFPKSFWKDGVIGGEIVTTNDEVSTWISGFLDLLFVLIFSKLQHVLDGCKLTEQSVFYVYCVMQIFFQIRYLLDEYTIRFYRDDIFHRIFFFFYIVGVMVMIQNMNLEPTSIASRRLASGAVIEDKYTCIIDMYYYRQFADGYYITKCWFLFLYCFVFYSDKSGKARRQFQYRVACTVVLITLLAFSTLMDDNWKLCVLFFLGDLDTIVDYGLSVLKTYFGVDLAPNYFPVSYSHTQERLGFYLLIVLGESLINLLLTSTDKSDPIGNYTRNSAGLLLIFAYAMQYFDQVQKVEGELHAFKRHEVAGVIYVVFHKFIGFFLIFTAFGISNTTDEGRINLCKGCGLTSLFMIVTRVLHKGIYYRFRKVSRLFHLSLHLGISLIHFLLAFADISHNNTLIIHALLSMMVVVIDIVMNLVKSKDASIISHHKTVELKRNSTLENFKENRMLEYIGITENDLPTPVFLAVEEEERIAKEENEIMNGKDVVKEILTEGVKTIKRRISYARFSNVDRSNSSYEGNNFPIERSKGTPVDSSEEGRNSTKKAPLAPMFSLSNLFDRLSSGSSDMRMPSSSLSSPRSACNIPVKNVLLDLPRKVSDRRVSLTNTHSPFQSALGPTEEGSEESAKRRTEDSDLDSGVSVRVDMSSIYDKNSNA